MDKYLEKEMKEFSDMLKAKGYRDLFLVNNFISGDLFPAMHATVMKAYEQEYDPFPMILHTTLLDPRIEGIPLLMLRVDRTDDGLKIRDAEVESLYVNGKPRQKNISFQSTGKFPSIKLLKDSIANMNKRKQKRKGL